MYKILKVVLSYTYVHYVRNNVQHDEKGKFQYSKFF